MIRCPDDPITRSSCVSVVDSGHRHLTASARRGSRFPKQRSRLYLNGSKLCENWKLFCVMPLHVGEAKPWLGHPPLSRANDQNDNRVMYVLDVAKFRSVFTSASLKISVLVSLIPIIAVTPMLELNPACWTWACVALAGSVASSPICPLLSLAGP